MLPTSSGPNIFSTQKDTIFLPVVVVMGLTFLPAPLS